MRTGERRKHGKHPKAAGNEDDGRKQACFQIYIVYCIINKVIVKNLKTLLVSKLCGLGVCTTSDPE